MPGYYAYIIGEDGHIKDREVSVCGDDEEAKRQAKRLVGGCAVELWEEDRKVERFEPSTSGRSHFISRGHWAEALRTRFTSPYRQPTGHVQLTVRQVRPILRFSAFLGYA